jgi:hypothetical protein
MLNSGMNPSRLRAFMLSVDSGGEDLTQARQSFEAFDLLLFHEAIDVPAEAIDIEDAIRVIEDYKPLVVHRA